MSEGGGDGGFWAMFGGAITGLVAWGRWYMKWRVSRLSALEQRLDDLEPKVECTLGVAVLYGGRLEQLSPDDPVFHQAKQLVGSRFPDLYARLFDPPHTTSPVINALADKLDDVPR